MLGIKRQLIIIIIIIIIIIVIIMKYETPKTWKANLFQYLYT